MSLWTCRFESGPGHRMHHKFTLILIALLIAGCAILSPRAHAQETAKGQVTVIKAQVLEVLHQEQREISGTGVRRNFQIIKVKLLEGDASGKVISIDNDYQSMRAGDFLYLTRALNAVTGEETYSFFEPYRIPMIIFFIGLFLAVLFIFGGTQGLRGLLSLAISFFFIAHLLLPGILHGYSPVLISIGVSSLIIILGSYVTHGFNKTTTAAVLGMIVTIIITGLLAYAAIHFGRFSGFTSEESVYLNFNTRGSINFVSLLLGSIMIGLLGVLYDAAIGQAIAVEELYGAGSHLSHTEVYKRAIRIGREHIGALVNILAIAYVGASLPLLLLFAQTSTQSSLVTMNQEIFATEIIRTMVGSIGLILAVPITTIVSVFLLF